MHDRYRGKIGIQDLDGYIIVIGILWLQITRNHHSIKAYPDIPLQFPQTPGSCCCVFSHFSLLLLKKQAFVIAEALLFFDF